MPMILTVFVCVFYLSFPETSEGKYISPFHDIPLHAEVEKVI